MVRPLSSVPGFVDPSKMHERFVEKEAEPQNQPEVITDEPLVAPIESPTASATPAKAPEGQEAPEEQAETATRTVTPETSVPAPQATPPTVFEAPSLDSVLLSLTSTPETEDPFDSLILPASAPRPSGAPEEGTKKAPASVLQSLIRDPVRTSAGGASSALPASFSQAIDKHEGAGSYDTLFGHAQRRGQFAGVKVSGMTVGEAIAFSSPSGPYAQSVKKKIGRVATPMGRYQIVGTTLRNAVKEMGLSMDTPFDKNTQDRIAAHLAKRRIQGAQTESGKIAALRAEWEGFKNVPTAQMRRIIQDLS